MTRNILSNYQFGFKKGKSTLHAIYQLASEITKSIDKDEQSLAVFMDLSKAFDSVSHSRLLNKLESIGIRGVPLQLFKSYLENRTQIVQLPYVDSDGCVQYADSTEFKIKTGVPQGSVLGPVLFLIYINDVFSNVVDGKMYLYADDATLFSSNSAQDYLEVNTHINLEILNEWFNTNNFKINTSKTKYMQFSRNLKLDPTRLTTIEIDNIEIEEKSDVNFLGIIIDQNLTFESHRKSVCNKLSTGIFILRKLTQMCDIKTLLTAYYGIIYPRMVYGIPVWGQIQNSLMKGIFKLQKYALRTMLKMHKRASCKGIFQKYKILTFPSIYIYETSLFVKNNLTLFDYKILRSKIFVRMPQYKTNFFRRRTIYNSVKIFNSLPSSMKKENITLSKFKVLLKTHLLNKEYYKVEEFISDGALPC